MKRIYIFGAHSRAQTLAKYLTVLDSEIEIVAFLYDNDEVNPKKIEGVPVFSLRSIELGEIEFGCPVYLAVRGVFHKRAEEMLRRIGFTDIVAVNVSFDAQLRKQYLKKRYADEGRNFILIDDLYADGADTVSRCIYEVRSVYDKELVKDEYRNMHYERPIQVGCALTELRLSECVGFDDEGENVSVYNRQLCEETALYWMWKHASEDILGLVHYRRHFILPDDWAKRMQANDIDIVVPIPLYVGPSVAENYCFRHVADDWNILMEVLREDSSEMYDAAMKVFSNDLYYPCNMFIMKREVMADYCSWLFPVLLEVMRRVGSHEDVYQNRYPAFMAERLLTLYVEIHRDKCHIVYADKGFWE